ncbi:secreted protein [Candidatus Magnetomorum sp. HK-1]|nr:secreted protein [Candidatus Magnetomorum sp. HK-1]
MNRFSKYLLIIFSAFISLNILFPPFLYSLPQDGSVIHGNTQITHTSPNKMEIQQKTNKTVINWSQFNIYQSESVSFIQPSSRAIALNRVLGINASIIDGLLSANGNIFLLNPNGIVIGKTGQVNVNGLLATTLNMSDSDFMNDNFVFEMQTNQSLSSIINKGSIKVNDGGFVSLLGDSVINEGVVIANLGTVHLGIDNTIEISFQGNDYFSFMVKENEKQLLEDDNQSDSITKLIENKGKIQANGGKVLISTRTAREICKSVINLDGLIESNTTNGYTLANSVTINFTI